MDKFDKNASDASDEEGKKNGRFHGTADKFYRDITKAMIAKGRINDTTLQYINSAIQNSETAEGYALRSKIHRELMEFEASIKDAETSLKKAKRTDVRVLRNLACVQFCAGEPVSALVNYQRGRRMRVHDVEFLSGIFASEQAINDMKLSPAMDLEVMLRAGSLEDFFAQTGRNIRNSNKVCDNQMPAKARISVSKDKWPQKHDRLCLLTAGKDMQTDYMFAKRLYELEGKRVRTLRRRSHGGQEVAKHEKISEQIQDLARELGNTLNIAAQNRFKLGKTEKNDAIDGKGKRKFIAQN